MLAAAMKRMYLTLFDWSGRADMLTRRRLHIGQLIGDFLCSPRLYVDVIEKCYIYLWMSSLLFGFFYIHACGLLIVDRM